MALKRYFLPAVIFAIFVFLCSVYVFWVVFDRQYGTSGTTIVAIIAQAGVWVPLGIAVTVAASARKPVRPPNYPRIEHLRIAGKHHSVRRFSVEEISPLHLSCAGQASAVRTLSNLRGARFT